MKDVNSGLWGVFIKRGVRLTDSPTSLVNTQEMSFLQLYDSFELAWKDSLIDFASKHNFARVDFQYNNHPAVLVSFAYPNFGQMYAASYLFIEMMVRTNGDLGVAHE